MSEAVTFSAGTTFRCYGGPWDQCFYSLAGDQSFGIGDVVLGQYRITRPKRGTHIPRLMFIKEGTTTDG